MGWKGLPETPSNRKELLEGLAVGLFVRYPRKQRRFQGASLYTLIFRTTDSQILRLID